ncbi:hypothetical protein, partial [Streptomyces phytophilus]|uniref:hypothetical protein n=1 Tax=Streptomyces phytophilus TaxID=722715 RepID=UPI00215DA085
MAGRGRGGAGGQEKAEELVGRLLAAGLPPDARGLADVLWLARELLRTTGAAAGADPRTDRPGPAARMKSATFPDAADAPETPAAKDA